MESCMAMAASLDAAVAPISSKIALREAGKAMWTGNSTQLAISDTDQVRLCCIAQFCTVLYFRTFSLSLAFLS
jgi:hypothetical protein